MLLGTDARTIYAETRRGTGKCLVELYRGLARLRPEWRVMMYSRENGAGDPFAGLANVACRRVDLPGDRWRLRQRLWVPMAARMDRADVLHCPANTGPRWPLVPMVLTIHDLIPLQPEFATPAAEKWGTRVGAAARAARVITTPSEYTKRRIVETFGIRPEKVVVHPWAANPGCRSVRDRDTLNRVRGKYGIEADRPYVLAFGGLGPRKNTRGILKAWALVSKRARGEAVLLVVGMQEPLLSELRQAAAGEGLAGCCRLYGYAPEEDLPALLSGAQFLCFPSLSEGFGLPVLDAFACETAVLTSRVTSIPEVAGDAAEYVHPRSVDAIAEGMVRLLRDDGLRRRLIGKGSERVKQFSWHRCAEGYCKVFEQFARPWRGSFRAPRPQPLSRKRAREAL